MATKIGLKDVATVTFYDRKTGEEMVYNPETKEMEGTGKIVHEPEVELVYSTENDDEDYDWMDDYACENGCCACCGCSCYDYDYEDDEVED